MAIKCFKLLSGEEVIADVVNETKEFVQLKNPFVLALVGEGQLGLMPYILLSESPECTINGSAVTCSYIPKQDLVNHYKKMTGGIVVAGAGALNQLPQVPPNFGGR